MWAAAASRLWEKGPLTCGSRGSQVALCPAATPCPASWSPQARSPGERDCSSSGRTFKLTDQGQVSFWAGMITKGWAAAQPQGSCGLCWVWGCTKDGWEWDPRFTAYKLYQTEGWFPSPSGTQPPPL